MTKTIRSVATQASQAILDVLASTPSSDERTRADPAARAKTISQRAARRSSLLAGTMALPPGILGWLTVLPEMFGVWRIQAQMVADLAALHGHTRALRREEMLYCLFKHVSAQVLRDVSVRVGERVLVREASAQALRAMAQALGLRLSQATFQRGAARLVPLVGAVGVGAYAYYDTLQVARTASALFASESHSKKITAD